ncbi:MAG: hypothetical protein AAF665_03795 [Pseudomonadota bacterium]
MAIDFSAVAHCFACNTPLLESQRPHACNVELRSFGHPKIGNTTMRDFLQGLTALHSLASQYGDGLKPELLNAAQQCERARARNAVPHHIQRVLEGDFKGAAPSREMPDADEAGKTPDLSCRLVVRQP